jgi:glycosyltransferase involved in cell wall biosynthesis
VVAPTISVIIPTYNRKGLLKECLESLFDQTYPRENYEIIVVDDGSSDGTEDLLKEMGAVCGNLRYIRQKNGGMFPAWNAGASSANGQILVLTDSDCFVPKYFLGSIISCFEKHPDIAACIGNSVSIFKNRLFSPLSSYYRSRYENKKDEDVVLCGSAYKPFLISDRCAIKKAAFLEVNGFDATGPVGQDVVLGFKLLKKGHKICKTDAFFVYHHQRDSIRGLIYRYYTFGLWDTAYFKEYFRNWFIIELPLNFKSIRFPRSPFTFYLRIDAFKIFTFLLILSFLFPKIGLILIALYFLRGYVISKEFRNDPVLFLLYKLHQYMIESAFFAGDIAGSIKNRVIYL